MAVAVTTSYNGVSEQTQTLTATSLHAAAQHTGTARRTMPHMKTYNQGVQVCTYPMRESKHRTVAHAVPCWLDYLHRVRLQKDD